MAAKKYQSSSHHVNASFIVNSYPSSNCTIWSTLSWMLLMV